MKVKIEVKIKIWVKAKKVKDQISSTKLKINKNRLDKQTNRQFANSLSFGKGFEVIDKQGEKHADRQLENSF